MLINCETRLLHIANCMAVDKNGNTIEQIVGKMREFFWINSFLTIFRSSNF